MSSGPPSTGADDDVEILLLDGDTEELTETSKNCIHQCVRPKNWTPPPQGSRNRGSGGGAGPAKTFAYDLDPFQKAAIGCLELGESVLVAAHTSAGKTTIAEYAIAMALRDKARVVYTSPIKALSNQKYRDLAEEFGDVGLMTGDVTLNPHASVIIMTTEILRSILYRGSELLREAWWVIFDEIHYMRDRDRGVIWEESIVLLPDSVRQVFLSATIPNALEFAEWVARIKHQPCHVISTSYRPTPLQHFVFPAGGDGVLLVMDESRKFHDANFKTAIDRLKMNDDAEPTAEPSWKKRKRKAHAGHAQQDHTATDLERIIGMCHENQYTPVIVFAFSKREVEENAKMLDRADLTDTEEKHAVEEIFANAIQTLSEEDRKLPQVTQILPMLVRGIGIHHGGLLPIVKEITELLFQELLIKVLFSTETFSMGINMPAKTVVFSSLVKFDGQKNRLISPGEYIQMSGRAGRRGLDKMGLSIVVLNHASENAEEIKELFVGEALRLDSNFYLKYNSILNLLRVQDTSPSYIINRSFRLFQQSKHYTKLLEEKFNVSHRLEKEGFEDILQREVRKLEDGSTDYTVLLPPATRQLPLDQVESQLLDYIDMINSYNFSQYAQRRLARTRHLGNILRFLGKGRVVEILDYGRNFNGEPFRLTNATQDEPGQVAESGDAPPSQLPIFPLHWGWGVVLGKRSRRLTPGSERVLIIDVLVQTRPYDTEGGPPSEGRPPLAEPKWTNALPPLDSSLVRQALLGLPPTKVDKSDPKALAFEIFPVDVSAIGRVSPLVMTMSDIDTSDAFKRSCGIKLVALKESTEIPFLDPAKDMGIQDPEVQQLMETENSSLAALKASPFHGWRFTETLILNYNNRIKLCSDLLSIENRLRDEGGRGGPGGGGNLISTLHSMEEVLRKLEYIDENSVVTLKGRVCCDISTVDELIIGEILFGNMSVSSLPVEYLCAMLSCLVHEEGDRREVEIEDPKLIELYQLVRRVAERIALVSVEAGLPVDPKAYVDRFQCSLMDATLAWMRGSPFLDVMSQTSAYEGSVVRSFRRLEEVLRDLAAAAKIMGSTALEDKFGAALTKLKRGIVFVASLYL